MQVLISPNFREASERVAAIVAKRLSAKPNLVLGLPTGETPFSLYRTIIDWHRAGRLDFGKVTTFNLDEYLGLGSTHPQSYRFFMDSNFFNHVNVPKERSHLLDGLTKDPRVTCAEYEQSIVNAGGIDLQILGIGGNGHIAFNEPGAPSDSRTRVVDLSNETVAANSDGRFFKDPSEVPRKALTMGIGTIIEAREVVLLAKGERKAEAIQRAVEGPMIESVPASILQRHPRCTFIVDLEAGSKLSKTYG